MELCQRRRRHRVRRYNISHVDGLGYGLESSRVYWNNKHDHVCLQAEFELTWQMAPESCLGHGWIWKFFQKLECREANL
jgi:hypothetical protein